MDNDFRNQEGGGTAKEADIQASKPTEKWWLQEMGHRHLPCQEPGVRKLQTHKRRKHHMPRDVSPGEGPIVL
jgi:hypothetical protein